MKLEKQYGVLKRGDSDNVTEGTLVAESDIEDEIRSLWAEHAKDSDDYHIIMKHPQTGEIVSYE